MEPVHLYNNKYLSVDIKHLPWNGATRGTEIKALLYSSNGRLVNIINVMSTCRGKDNFSKKEGRRRAAMALLRKLRKYGYPKEDRGMVFDHICPEYKNT